MYSIILFKNSVWYFFTVMNVLSRKGTICLKKCAGVEYFQLQTIR